MADKAKKPKADWEAIEREYRAGQQSLREIGRQFGVTEGAIRKKAKAEGWARNLLEAVRETAAAELVRSEVRTADSRAIVAEAAGRVVEIVRSHRKDIRGARDLASRLMGELDVTTTAQDEIVSLIEAETANDKSPKRRNAMLRMIELPNRARVIADLSRAMHTLVGLERQAFSIDPKGGETPEPKNQGERLAEVNKELEEIFAHDPEPKPSPADASEGS
jgi:hypothetical protein